MAAPTMNEGLIQSGIVDLEDSGQLCERRLTRSWLLLQPISSQRPFYSSAKDESRR
jgi:hypothetical protein